jgi:hypothetical protein
MMNFSAPMPPAKSRIGELHPLANYSVCSAGSRMQIGFGSYCFGITDGSLRGSYPAGCKTLFQCAQPLRAMAMQSNGDIFDAPRVLLADQQGSLYLLQSQTRASSAWPEFELIQQCQRHSGAVRSLCALANGGWLSAAEDGQILQHSADLQSVKRLARLNNFACDALPISFDCSGSAPQNSPNTLICAGYDGIELRPIL